VPQVVRRDRREALVGLLALLGGDRALVGVGYRTVDEAIAGGGGGARRRKGIHACHVTSPAVAAAPEGNAQARIGEMNQFPIFSISFG
jgi:hypothetical protein